MRVKYIRWSTIQQSGARQLLDSSNYDLVLQEQISGSIPFAKRPKGAELMKLIESGKVTELFVEEISRLGRNSFDNLTTLNFCEKKGVVVHIQNMCLSSVVNNKPNPLFKSIVESISSFAYQEMELIKERTEMGKVAARNRGVVFGRKIGSNESAGDFLGKRKNSHIFKLLKSGNLTIRDIAKKTKTSTATVIKVKKLCFKSN